MIIGSVNVLEVRHCGLEAWLCTVKTLSLAAVVSLLPVAGNGLNSRMSFFFNFFKLLRTYTFTQIFVNA